MGAAESTIRNVDKRTARREHRDVFIGSVRAYREKFDPRPAAGDPLGDADRAIRVCVRKRPMFEWEYKKEREFDVITGGADRVVIHDARMEKDMRNMYMDHHEFDFDTVFNEKATNDEVYAGTASELVRLASEGGQSTVLMYGQTGSGKTYTMSSVYERAAADLFGLLGGELAAGTVTISVSFVELAAEKCRDMLNPNMEGGREVKLCTGRNGEVHPVPVTEVPIGSPQALITYIDHATSLRATCATGVHDQSSRSHAVCRVYIDRGDGQEGTLTLVDLAGSEQKGDSMYHDADRRKEGAAINGSLMALKAVVRERVKGTDRSSLYRNNKLTQLLKTSFCIKEARTVVIATVSPSSKDTEHSLSTLRHACIMDGQGDGDEKRFQTGGVAPNATRSKCGAVDVGAISRANKANGGAKDLRGGAQRGAIAKAKKQQSSEYETGQFGGGDKGSGGAFGDAKLEKKKQEQAKLLERRKNERAAMRRLDPTLVQALVDARAACASGVKQRRRLERGVEPEDSGGAELAAHYGQMGADSDAGMNPWVKENGEWVQVGADGAVSEAPQAQTRLAAAPARKRGDAQKRRQLTAQIMSDSTTPAQVKLRQLKTIFKKKGLDWSQKDEDAAIAVAAENGQELYTSEQPSGGSSGGGGARSRPTSAAAAPPVSAAAAAAAAAAPPKCMRCGGYDDVCTRCNPGAAQQMVVGPAAPAMSMAPPASSDSRRAAVQNSPPRSPGMDSTASSRRRPSERAEDERGSPALLVPLSTNQQPEVGAVSVRRGGATSAALENLSCDDAIQLRQIRQQRAKEKREEEARKTKAAAQEKLRAKSQRGAGSAAARPGSGVSGQSGQIGGEIARLEAELASGDVSAATAHGLKKRLATLKASHIREQRKAEAAQRQAKQQQQKEAAEAKRRAARDAAAPPPAPGPHQSWDRPEVDQGWDRQEPAAYEDDRGYQDQDDRGYQDDGGYQQQQEYQPAQYGYAAQDQRAHVSYGCGQAPGAYGASAAPWGNAANENESNEGQAEWDSRDV